MASTILTVEDLADYLEIPGKGREDALRILVDGVNAHIERETGRTWSTQTYDERYLGGQYSLVLRHYPVTEIIQISEDGDVVDHTDPEEVEILASAGVLDRVPHVWEGATRERRVRVQYKAGQPAPLDLRMAAAEMAAYLWRRRGGVEGKGSEVSRVQMAKVMLKDLPGVGDVIRLYRDPAQGLVNPVVVL